MFTLDTIFAPSPQILSRLVEHEAVLVLPEQGKVKVLNEVGARIWTLTDGKLSVAEIARSICAEFAVDQLTAEADTLAFLTDLAARGIVVERDLSHPPSA